MSIIKKKHNNHEVGDWRNQPPMLCILVTNHFVIREHNHMKLALLVSKKILNNLAIFIYSYLLRLYTNSRIVMGESFIEADHTIFLYWNNFVGMMTFSMCVSRRRRTINVLTEMAFVFFWRFS